MASSRTEPFLRRREGSPAIAPLSFPTPDITNVIKPSDAIRAIIGAMNSPIDLKLLVARIPFKIEPKPDGGFIARASDPTVAPIEASTREELTQKILAAVRSEFPELQIPAGGKNVQVSVQLKNGNDEFSVSTNPNETAGAEHAIDIANPALEKLLGFATKHFAPELLKQLAEQGGTTSFQLTVNNKTAIRVNSGPQGLTFGAAKNPAVQNPSGEIQKLDAGAGLIDGHPITPEPSNFGKILKIIVWVMIIGVIVYLFLLSRQ